jgi:hypothetical protein
MFTDRTQNAAVQNPFLSASPSEAPKSEILADEPTTGALSIELMILWGTSVVHIAHLAPPRSFYIGAQDCDFALPEGAFGAARIPVILVDKLGAVRLVLPAGAEGTITSLGSEIRVRDAIASGKTIPSAELAGASEIELTPGAKADIEIAGLTFRIELGRAAKAVATRAPIDTQSLVFQGLSTLLHASLLAAAAIFVPPLGLDDEGSISPEQRYMIQQALDSTATPETAKTDAPLTADAPRADAPGASGQASIGEAGKLGSLTSKSKSGRFGIAPSADSATPEISRAAAIADAGAFGMIGILSTLNGDLNVPTAPWGGLASSGNDATNALGNLWGPDIGEAAGANGLTLSGIGEGGGKKGEGIGMDGIGTIGDGLGNPGGFGQRKLADQARKGGAPIMRQGPTTVEGRIPAEVIQRAVRQNFGRFRFCYQDGLRNNPSLAGRVAVRFVIDRGGAVSTVANGGSDLPDANVVSCVVRAFYGLSFPPPDNGIVMVTYPLMFSPGN